MVVVLISLRLVYLAKSLNQRLMLKGKNGIEVGCHPGGHSGKVTHICVLFRRKPGKSPTSRAIVTSNLCFVWKKTRKISNSQGYRIEQFVFYLEENQENLQQPGLSSRVIRS
ncbi:hypothetical protein AVEN_149147-1 [Araneus ventricosus]|uniref:Uncharacterized protein n=1 Tax=Araneus ventricosus TaxID=182803 RepID=A0A4Y2LKD4_ARAVE|nr:hypothetical protein AVEN_149147-1 [Araneus ventricosus]